MEKNTIGFIVAVCFVVISSLLFDAFHCISLFRWLICHKKKGSRIITIRHDTGEGLASPGNGSSATGTCKTLKKNNQLIHRNK